MSRGSAEIPEWSLEQTKELQQLLARRGYTVGEIDGKLGAATRAGVKAAQIKFGLPADSYPTQRAGGAAARPEVRPSGAPPLHRRACGVRPCSIRAASAIRPRRR